MLNLFRLSGIREDGLNCDCCVEVRRFTMDVFAKDDAHVRELIRGWRGFAGVNFEFINEGPVEKITVAGIKLNGVSDVYRGYHGSSPFRQDLLSLS